MNRLAVIGGLFALAGLCEIAGSYLVWGYLRQDKPLFWALLGVAVLVSYGVVAALQPIPAFGRVYAAYGGVFVGLALLWGITVERFCPDMYDVLGAIVAFCGMLVMVVPSRG